MTYLHVTETFGRQSQKKECNKTGIISNDGCMENCIKLKINASDKCAGNK